MSWLEAWAGSRLSAILCSFLDRSLDRRLLKGLAGFCATVPSPGTVGEAEHGALGAVGRGQSGEDREILGSSASMGVQ